MLTLERQNEILEYLKQNKTATVRDLATRLYVSDATIRRDLAEMEILGLLRRSHGGAVLLEKNRDELSVLVRMEQNADAKRIISELTIPLLEPYASFWRAGRDRSFSPRFAGGRGGVGADAILLC